MIYHDTHVSMPTGAGAGGGCAVKAGVKEWMEEVQNSVEEEEEGEGWQVPAPIPAARVQIR